MSLKTKDPHKTTTLPSTIREIKRRCVAAYAQGAERISVNTYMCLVRDELKVSVNRSDQSEITDQLIEENPGIPIETRARGKRGKNKPATPIAVDLAQVLQIFGERPALRLKAVTIVTATGQEYTIPMAKISAKVAA